MVKTKLKDFFSKDRGTCLAPSAIFYVLFGRYSIVTILIGVSFSKHFITCMYIHLLTGNQYMNSVPDCSDSVSLYHLRDLTG